MFSTTLTIGITELKLHKKSRVMTISEGWGKELH